jgi:hypothetical protein
MAKTKGDEPGKSKPTKGKVKDSGGEFAKPSEAPAGGDSWSLTDLDDPKSGDGEGHLYLITPLRTATQDVTRGKKTESVDIIIADVVDLNERKPAKSELHPETYIWPKYVQGSLRGFIGDRMVLGRLAKVDDAKSAVGYHWELEDADDDDTAVAKAYLATVDPFGKGKASKTAKGKK